MLSCAVSEGERIGDFFREFGIAIVAVILVTMLLLPLRVALVSAVAIPVTVSITFAMLNAFGIELHQVSISALIVALVERGFPRAVWPDEMASKIRAGHVE